MRNVIGIDADLIVYKAAAAVQTNLPFAGPVAAVSADYVRALGIVDNEIAKLRRELDAGEVVLMLSDPVTANNFRRQVYPAYKCNRSSTNRPVLFKQLRADIESRFGTRWYPGLEGDDCLGVWLTTPGHPERVVASIDKDFATVPGRWYNWNRPEKGVLLSTCEDADRALLFQTLTGDPVDAYPGCPGIGPKKAAAILAGDSPVWPRVVRAYERKGLTEDDAVAQARCAFILRYGSWNKHVGVRGWVPSDLTV